MWAHVILVFLEVGEHICVRPVEGTILLLPMVEVPSIATNVHLKVDHAGTTEHLATGPVAPVVIHGKASVLLRHSSVVPVKRPWKCVMASSGISVAAFSTPPASISSTVRRGSAESLLASTHPADPPPTMM
uniref:Uncharacterized protein n=1 Tax=Rhipicephalus microplus TaxID=6941 RepID=A0A6G5AH35_RHIMP